MIYLDNASTSFPKAPGVSQAVCDYLDNIGANAGRSSHRLAREASRIIFETREKLAEFLGINDSSRLIFTANATEALNNVIFGLVNPGDTVLTSSLEHNSVMRPLRYLEKEQNINILQFTCNQDSTINLSDFKRKLAFKPDHVITTACSNVSGVILPLERMAPLIRSIDSSFIVDGSQLTGMYPVNVGQLDPDAFCFPGHKGLLGPTGTGGFYIREGLDLNPIKYGGTGSRSNQEIQPAFLPDRFESGTPNIAGLAGLGKALEFLSGIGIKKIRDHKIEIIDMFQKELDQLGEYKILGPKKLEDQIGIISVISDKISITKITQELDENNIAVRMGMHCAPSAHKTLGTFSQGGTVRFSPGFFTTEADIKVAIGILRKLIR